MASRDLRSVARFDYNEYANSGVKKPLSVPNNRDGTSVEVLQRPSNLNSPAEIVVGTSVEVPSSVLQRPSYLDSPAEIVVGTSVEVPSSSVLQRTSNFNSPAEIVVGTSVEVPSAPVTSSNTSVEVSAALDNSSRASAEAHSAPTFDSGTSVEVPVAVDNMSTLPVEAKIAGQLKGLLLEADDAFEEVQDVPSLELCDLQTYYNEIKQLRINMVKVSEELKVLQNGAALHNEQEVQEKIEFAKCKVVELKKEITQRKGLSDINQQRARDARENERRYVFDTTLDEFVTNVDSLIDKYDVTDDENITTDTILKRKDVKDRYTSERHRLRTLLDKLLDFSDVQFQGKELLLNAQIAKLKTVDALKEAFEDKLRMDLEMYDLTDQKLRLATLTKVDIGKFSGATGEDFYTFRSKFAKAYKNHPRDLKVDWLKNNHLEGKARECVGALEDLEMIWNRLKDNFGNTEQLLLYHFDKINNIGHMSQQKSLTAKKFYMQNLINAMQDVKQLATDHQLLNELCYSQQLDKIVALFDQFTKRTWFQIVTQEKINKPQRWDRMLGFLEAELSILQAQSSSADSLELSGIPRWNGGRKDNKGTSQNTTRNVVTPVNFAKRDACTLCDETHPNANYGFFKCRKFLIMTVKERCDHVREKQKCLQCLDSKTKWNDPSHSCMEKWICRDASHVKYSKKLHFMVCSAHTDNEENKKLFEEFKKEILIDEWQKKVFKGKVSYICRNAVFLKKGAHNPTGVPEVDSMKVEPVGPNASCVEDDVIDTTTRVEPAGPDASCVENDVIDTTRVGPAAFMLQPVEYNDKIFNFMFDTGCGGFVARKIALDKLPSEMVENILKGRVLIQGVGDNQVVSEHGYYSVKFPIHTGQFAMFQGVCLDVVTGAIPPYPVREASKDIVKSYVSVGGKDVDLPSLPLLVGGETDFLLGIQYNYFQPRLIHMLPSGFGIYKSMFRGVDGTRGCVGGPHPLFMQCEQQFAEFSQGVDFRTFLSQQLKLFQNGVKVCLDYDVFHNGHSSPDNVEVDEPPVLCNQIEVDSANVNQLILRVVDNLQTSSESSRPVRTCHIAALTNETFEKEPVVLSLSRIQKAIEVDQTGSVIDYRCSSCRGCSKCKNGDQIEKVSLKEEYEQSLIDASVTVDTDAGISTATLPFIANPEAKLANNKDMALKMYRHQLKRLDKDPVEKERVIEFEGKLQSAGFVEYVHNLTPSQQELVYSASLMHFLSWHVVHNENSVTTDTRTHCYKFSCGGGHGLLPFMLICEKCTIL